MQIKVSEKRSFLLLKVIVRGHYDLGSCDDDLDDDHDDLGNQPHNLPKQFTLYVEFN